MIGGGVLPLSESGLALLLDIDELPGVFLSFWAGGACGILETSVFRYLSYWIFVPHCRWQDINEPHDKVGASHGSTVGNWVAGCFSALRSLGQLSVLLCSL